MNKIVEKLITHQSFIEEKSRDFLEKNKVAYLLKSKNSFFHYIKFLKDLNKEEIEAFNLFKEKCLIDLRSRNKSSNQGIEGLSDLELRSVFFKKNNIYHHHLIDQKTYEQEYFFNQKGQKIFLPKNELKTIQDHIENLYHTSGLCLHYQKKILEQEIYYKILFISKHPIAKEWDNTKNFIEKNKIFKDTNIAINTYKGKKNE